VRQFPLFLLDKPNCIRSLRAPWKPSVLLGEALLDRIAGAGAIREGVIPRRFRTRIALFPGIRCYTIQTAQNDVRGNRSMRGPTTNVGG